MFGTVTGRRRRGRVIVLFLFGGKEKVKKWRAARFWSIRAELLLYHTIRIFVNSNLAQSFMDLDPAILLHLPIVFSSEYAIL